MSIRDQDIMVRHPTIPNPLVIRDQAIATVHLHTIPNPMVIPDRAITAVPGHTIPSPMVIRVPADKWWPVISPLRHRWCRPRARCLGILLGFEQLRSKATIRRNNENVPEEVVIRPGSRYVIFKVTNCSMTANKGVWSWTAQEVQ
jgi:hypothetical protein